METCVGCGAAVAAAEADLTADGVRCRRCSLGAEVQGHVANVAMAEAQRRGASLQRRTANVARGHLIIWLSTVIIFCGVNGAAHQLWFAPLALLVLVPVVGLLLRQRWAWWIMVGVDGAVALALFGWAALAEGDVRLLLLVVAAIPALLVVGLCVEL